MIGRVIAIGLALAGLAACEPAPAAPELDGGVVSKDGISTQSTSLIDHEAWVFSEVDEDPFPHHRPEAFSCESWSYRVEDDAFEVDTGTCDYITVVQPTRVDLAKGDLIEAALWHQTLLGEDGVAHVAIAIGGDLIWEEEIQIWSKPGAYTPLVMSPAAYPAGTLIAFHLHNHGANNWQLLYVKRLR